MTSCRRRCRFCFAAHVQSTATLESDSADDAARADPLVGMAPPSTLRVPMPAPVPDGRGRKRSPDEVC